MHRIYRHGQVGFKITFGGIGVEGYVFLSEGIIPVVAETGGDEFPLRLEHAAVEGFPGYDGETCRIRHYQLPEGIVGEDIFNAADCVWTSRLEVIQHFRLAFQGIDDGVDIYVGMEKAAVHHRLLKLKGVGSDILRIIDNRRLT